MVQAIAIATQNMLDHDFERGAIPQLREKNLTNVAATEISERVTSGDLVDVVKADFVGVKNSYVVSVLLVLLVNLRI